MRNSSYSIHPTWSLNSVIYEGDRVTTFSITDTKLYVPAVTQDNTKLLQKLTSEFKYTVNWNKYQSKVTTQKLKPIFKLLIDPSFQGVNRIFVL